MTEREIDIYICELAEVLDTPLRRESHPEHS